MSLFFQKNINDTTKLGIWKIEEPEEFFLQKVPLQREITHPHKRLQHLAGRYLLQYLFPNFPYAEILIADTRKPYLPDEQYHFSISHCSTLAAVIVSTTHRCGVDIEKVSERIATIMEKFMGTKDLLYLGKTKHDKYSPLQFLTAIWSAKEAIFKWYTLGKVNFKEQIQLNDAINTGDNNTLQLSLLFNKSQSEDLYKLDVSAMFFDDVVASWVNTES